MKPGWSASSPSRASAASREPTLPICGFRLRLRSAATGHAEIVSKFILQSTGTEAHSTKASAASPLALPAAPPTRHGHFGVRRETWSKWPPVGVGIDGPGLPPSQPSFTANE